MSQSLDTFYEIIARILNWFPGFGKKTLCLPARTGKQSVLRTFRLQSHQNC